jgi:aspartate 1-decarboxylase
MRWVIRSKIHNATVTEANLAYVGSITIDKALIHQAGLWVGERVLVVSNTSGARLETYIIEGPEGSGSSCMNGAAAHLITKGEQVIIMGFELVSVAIKPSMILVDQANRFVRSLSETARSSAEQIRPLLSTNFLPNA